MLDEDCPKINGTANRAEARWSDYGPVSFISEADTEKEGMPVDEIHPGVLSICSGKDVSSIKIDPNNQSWNIDTSNVPRAFLLQSISSPFQF